MSIDELQKGERAVKSYRTLSSYKAILNQINDSLGLERNIIHFDKLIEHKDQLIDIVKSTWKIRSIVALRQKISAISSLMTRTGFDNEHPVRSLSRKIDRMEITFDNQEPQVIPPWEEMKEKLIKFADHNRGVAGTIARIFSYGYVLRVREMFMTRVARDDGYHNYLDLDKCVWTIRIQKNGEEKIFDVDPELCKQIPKKSVWLFGKSTGEPYSPGASHLTYHGWVLEDNNTIRKSFETWNCLHSGRSREEQIKWNKILGHSRNVNETPKKIKPKIVKKEHKREFCP